MFLDAIIEQLFKIHQWTRIFIENCHGSYLRERKTKFAGRDQAVHLLRHAAGHAKLQVSASLLPLAERRRYSSSGSSGDQSRGSARMRLQRLPSCHSA